MTSISSVDEKPKRAKTGWERLKQQELSAWQPIFSPKGVSPLFLVIGVVLIPLGVLIFTMSKNIEELKFDYTDCRNPSGIKCLEVISTTNEQNCTCTIQFEVTEPLKEKIYLYYALTNFYQNHREYVDSRDDDQLLGSLSAITSPSSNCDPYRDGPNGTVYFPCGAIANSLFSDTFKLFHHQSDGSKMEVNLIRKGIAWESDKKHKFKNPDIFNQPDAIWDNVVAPRDWPSYKTLWNLDEEDTSNNGLQNEDLIVWMRVSALPNFRKLHRFINTSSLSSNKEMPKGNYSFEIHYSYEVDSFGGTKTIILTEEAFFGGRNITLGIMLMSVGSIILLLGLLFLLLSLNRRKTWSRRRSTFLRDYGTQGTTTLRRSKIA